ncbi:PIR Superfamily Protein [Plasmodium ovale wallikeri]|uniref:PIR Superfamily Protein n=1 Tax=Plasmodium ovale wallikeri TaxID=864142 RepID=A0A1A9APF5_PLAOA|nr:PIR Superfamily Protein [Plasmodium ovale wallikeri]
MSDFPYDFSYDEKLILKFCHNFNIDAFNENKIIECKYMDYIGKGLKEYHDTLKRCSEKTEQSNYCKDFNELNEIYKEDYIYWKNSTSDYKYIYNEEDTFTNIGSFFDHVNEKNNTMFLNMDTEQHNLTQPNPEFENSNFESSRYDISYYLLNNC